MIEMGRKLIIATGILLLAISFPGAAQGRTAESDSLDIRQQTLARARYLKSIFKTDEAIDTLSTLVVADRFDEELLSELADCHFQNADYESAVSSYNMLSLRAPRNILYKLRLMQGFYRLKEFPASIQAGQEALQLDTIAAVVSFVGDAFRQMEMADSALCYYRRALELKPMNESVVAKATDILLSAEDYDGALSMTGPFLENDPDNASIAPLRGLAYYRKGDYDSAIELFQRQEDIGNDSYPIHYYLGQCYWHANVTYRAEQELLKAWSADSSDVNLAYSIAAVKMEGYAPFEEEVKPWLDKALEMMQPDPVTMSRVHQQYGLAYYRRQDSWDKAIEHYKEAYRYNPKFISALSTIAYCYEIKKEYRQALEWYEKYLALAAPDSPGYEFASKSIEFLKAELFMEEK